MEKVKEYAVYKGDDLLAIGTAQELAKYFNVKPRTVQFWGSPANHRRNQNKYGNRKIAIVIEEEE